MPASIPVPKAISLLFAVLLVGCPPPTVERSPPAPAPRDPADLAAADLRDRLIALDVHGCARDGEPLVRQHPASGRLRAWWIGCVAASGRQIEARALADSMLSERPGDPWAELARLLAVVGGDQIADPVAWDWSDALLDRLPVRADAVLAHAWLLVDMRRGPQLLELAAREPDTPASARVYALLDAARGDPTRLPEALAVAGGVAPDDPDFVRVAATAAQWLPLSGRPVDALEWAEAGLRRAPDVAWLLHARWHLAPRQPGAGDVADAVLADIDDTLATYPDRPDLLLVAAAAARDLGRADRAALLEARLLAEHPDSPAAEALLFRRLEPGPPRPGAPFDPEAALLRDTMLAAYLARPVHHDPIALAEVARWRLENLAADPNAAPEALLAAVEDTIARAPDSPHPRITGAWILFRRTGDLERAGALAREGLAALDTFAAAWERAGASNLDILRRDYTTIASTVLGHLHLRTGQLDDAEAELRRAERHTFGPFAPLQLGLADLARRRGDLDAAEEHLLAGIHIPGEDGERCRGALADLHRQRTGSNRGLSDYIADLEVRSRERRKREALATYDDAAEPLPDFRLRSVDGRLVTLSELRGKLVVLHFWFNTCAGCLLELPQFSAFAAAHVDDPDVAVVSVHFGGERDAVARWCHERALPFPVLMDNGYAQRVGVRSYPTTWFLDPEGRRRFDASVVHIRDLQREFDWRLDALRARAAPPSLTAG